MLTQVTDLAHSYKPQMLDFCQRLIRVPSLSGVEKDVADLYLAEMTKLGYDELFRDAWGNVVGIVKGNTSGPTIMFNGHLDHVDTGDPGQWGGYDPYGGVIDVARMFDQDMRVEEETEVVHGRAAADVKGGGAGLVYAGAILMELKRQGFQMKGNYLVSFTVHEEPAEMLGMIKLMDETFPARNLSPSACISCEATSLKLYLGHRGRVEFKVVIEGVTSHASAPWLGINAVNKATRFIDRVEEVVRVEGRLDEQLGCSSIALTVINCTPGSMCIVPDRCIITYDRRFPPSETPEICVAQIQRVIDELAAADPDFKATVSVSKQERVAYTGLAATLPNQKEAWKLDPDHPVTRACAAALSDVGQEVKYGYWNFGTDLPITHVRHGIPSLGYSGMQEFYCHRTVDAARTDFLEKGLAGYAAMFMRLSVLEPEDFKL